MNSYSYTAQEVRSAITGHSNASKEHLAYAVMVGCGLIGQAKSTPEWEAIAVGRHHLLSSSSSKADSPPGSAGA